MKKAYYLFCLSLCLFACSRRFVGGERIKGNNNLKTERRTVSAFDGIDASGHMLKVKTGDGINPDATRRLVVYVAAPVFREASVSGSGDNVITGTEALSKEKMLDELPPAT